MIVCRSLHNKIRFTEAIFELIVKKLLSTEYSSVIIFLIIVVDSSMNHFLLRI